MKFRIYIRLLTRERSMRRWRFWITDENDRTTAENIGSFVNAELSWDDSYTGGSCLQLHGATKFSRIKLFKTKLLTQPSYELSLTYKMPKGRDTHARLFVALKGNSDCFRRKTSRQGRR